MDTNQQLVPVGLADFRKAQRATAALAPSSMREEILAFFKKYDPSLRAFLPQAGDQATFWFEEQQYAVPLDEARNVCYMNDGLIELPDHRLVCVTVYATPPSPSYIINEVELYTNSARQGRFNPSQRVHATLVH